MKIRTIVIGMMLLFVPVVYGAGIEPRDFEDESKEKTYEALLDELRCLVCQNQNLAESNADLAKDLREKVYTMVAEGQDREEVVDFLVARYGDFVLYRPPIRPRTYLLWGGPAIFLLIGTGFLVWNLRRRRPADEAAPDPAAVARAHQLLESDEDRSRL